MDEVDVRTIQYAMEEAECAAIDAMNEELLLPLLLHQLLLKITSIVGSEVMVVMIAVILAVRGTQEPFFDIGLCSNRIIGIAKFEYMGPYSGVLSHMDRTLRCSSHYFGGDLAHKRHWRVVGGARLRVPAIIDAVGFGLSRPTNMMFAVTQDFRDQLLASPLYGSESLARDFLTNWGVIVGKDRESSGESQLAETAAGSASSSGSQSAEADGKVTLRILFEQWLSHQRSLARIGTYDNLSEVQQCSESLQGALGKLLLLPRGLDSITKFRIAVEISYSYLTSAEHHPDIIPDDDAEMSNSSVDSGVGSWRLQAH